MRQRKWTAVDAGSRELSSWGNLLPAQAGALSGSAWREAAGNVLDTVSRIGVSCFDTVSVMVPPGQEQDKTYRNSFMVFLMLFSWDLS